MDLTRVFESAHALHAASVHLPISLGILGLPLAVAAVLARRRWPGMRLFAAAYFFLTFLVTVAASLTGQRAASELVALANEEIEAVVAQHQMLGFSMTGLALVTFLLLIASHFRASSGGKTVGGFAVISALALAVVLLFGGSSGGRLVYGFGIGTPIAGADGTSGATLIVGAYADATMAGIPPVLTGVVEPADADYTPKILPIDLAEASSVGFRADIMPILERHCIKCHHGNGGEAGLDLSTHAGILKGGDYAGPSVTSGAPDNSPVVRHIRGIYLPKMPKDSDELTESELHTIRMWVASGARGE